MDTSSTYFIESLQGLNVLSGLAVPGTWTSEVGDRIQVRISPPTSLRKRPVWLHFTENTAKGRMFPMDLQEGRTEWLPG